MGQTHLEDMLEVVNRLAFIPLAQQAIYDFNLENNSKGSGHCCDCFLNNAKYFLQKDLYWVAAVNCLEILIINLNMALDSNTALVIDTFL